ncbi:MAG: Oxygen-independent coproporphyrinogen-III oxidase 1 [Pelotomaculum sp. PtaB.Bin104]|nr:MAG: Oxygen-independent coproporphyrinogen-III oxidase 1 [Pelotomaculum sp. PtaB.Bin104]
MLSTLLRVLLAGQLKPFRLNANEIPRFNPHLENFGLYAHIPFCRRICPFCPYNKMLYREDKAEEYCKALLVELRRYKEKFSAARIDSVYFGGGTPTSVTPRLVQLIDEIRGLFDTGKHIGVEAHPNDLNPENLRLLREAGVNMLSIGVQTFDSQLLKIIGRPYDGAKAKEAVQMALNTGFDTVDVDLIFALPGQKLDDVVNDVAMAFALGAQQVSAYPLIIFLYTGMKAHVRRLGLKKTGMAAEKKMLNAIIDLAQRYGYKRTSIWTYTREGAPRYSSVTRERFVGIGAGAASLNSGYFYLNTFDVEQYVDAVKKRLPVSVGMKLPDRVEMLYWLYWRMYDMDIPSSRFTELFHEPIRRRFGLLLATFLFFGLATSEGDSIKLTKKGAYLFHLVEKGHSWDYLCRVWAGSMKESWPSEIIF